MYKEQYLELIISLFCKVIETMERKSYSTKMRMEIINAVKTHFLCLLKLDLLDSELLKPQSLLSLLELFPS